MTRLVDAQGSVVTLGKSIGKGGEGEVFELRSHAGYVGKLYHQPLDRDKSEKLAAMTRMPSGDIQKFAAWPKSTLHPARGGPTVGIIMPKVEAAREIHELYATSHRALHFPTADWRFLVRAARNSAIAFHTLHEAGVVIGDVNQGNLFVSRQAMVRMIDCDSFQFSIDERTFRCLVGVADYTPPELQARKFSEVVRTVNHDNFGLAVIIFQLLFMGRHPFVGRYEGTEEMPMPTAIQQYRFAFGSQAKRYRMAPPPKALRLSEISAEVAELFEKAFAKGAERAGSRPTASQWAEALAAMELELTACTSDASHYRVTQADCPWCRIQREGGPHFFISVAMQSAKDQVARFNLPTVWRKITAVKPPGADYRPRRPINWRALTPRPQPDLPDYDELPRRMVAGLFVAGTLVAMLGMWWPLVGVFGGVNSVIFVLWWFYLRSQHPVVRHRAEFRHHLADCKRRLNRLKQEMKTKANDYIHQFSATQTRLSQLRAQLEGLDQRRLAELEKLYKTEVARQRDDYLRKCFISDHGGDLWGIGQGRLATLESYGIETAYDINANNLALIRGIGPALSASLLNWRAAKEREFRFDHNQGQRGPMAKQLDRHFLQLKFNLTKQLEQGPAELEKITREAHAEVDPLDAKLAELEQEVAQLKADRTLLA